MANTQLNNQIQITLPDESKRHYESGITGKDVAFSIGEGLGKASIAIKINGELKDLNTPIHQDCALEIITMRSEEALELIRHDCAHIMAEAVQELFPGTQVTIGPAIEDGFYYDFYREESFTPEDLPKIEAKMAEIIKRDKEFVRSVMPREEAIDFFKIKGEDFKVELIQDLPENEEITLYSQGDWIDPCRGPHMPSTGKIGKAFKLMSIAGAYWRGDSNNPMLQRIYGTAWRDKKELDTYLTQLEEAEKRDHRKLGKQLDLFHFQEEAPGQVFWHNKGWSLYLSLLGYMRNKIKKYGYIEVNTPQMLDSRFWHASGHWDKYHENMFVIDDDRNSHPIALKPMSCPGGAQLYKHTKRSYRELPIRMAEFGKVFRKEASGARHGLMRVQAFTQDDAHIFCTDEQLEEEVIKMCDLIKEVYTDLDLAEGLTIYFSTRPEQRIGEEADWDRAEEALKKILDRMEIKWVLNEGDGAFYAPKLDFMVQDAIGRQWQCGTVQVDMNMPRRMNMTYIDSDGEEKTPHMVHRAIFGSVERFLGILIENYAGAFPLWLAPIQAVVATVNTDTAPYAKEIVDQLTEHGIRVEGDYRNEKISYKVREHSLQKINYIIAVGAREAEEKTVSIRRFGSQKQEIMPLDNFINLIVAEAKTPL